MLRLINGLNELPSDDKLTRIFEKKGSYLTAIRDFKSVSPEKISTFSLPSGVSKKESQQMIPRFIDFFLSYDVDVIQWITSCQKIV